MKKTRELPTEIWDFLFFASNGGLTGSDKVVLSKSSPVFEEVLRRKLLEECVTHLIPVVAPYLSKRDLLKLRQTCKGLKQRVEEFEENRFGSSILASLEFGDDDQRWSELAGMIEKQGGNGTLGRCLSLAVEPEMKLEKDKAAQFFQKWGHRIVNLKLRVTMTPGEPLRSRLLHYLKFCGNLRRLQLFPEVLCTRVNHFSTIIYNVYSREAHLRMPGPIELPFLTELQFFSKIIERAENAENRIVRSTDLKRDLFFQSIFCSHMEKLTKLKIDDPDSYFPHFLSEFMPSALHLTDLSTVLDYHQYAMKILRVLQSKGTKLKKLTLRAYGHRELVDVRESKVQLANYLRGAETLRTLSLQFEDTRVAFFADFPPLETEFNSSVRSIILRNVIFPDGKGLQNLGFKFKSLYKLHLSYDELENEENYDFIPDTNHIFEHVPNLRQVSLKSFNTPTVYSINHQKPT